ncbi:hypothetical protein ANN_23616 [Periplaneta americana]|uniref:Uncharacterized protein n=1 Tax=Periplaneta americana TaxID=6978 RepID=A0ABQ8SLL8_PERAM|nr:hypothetical protein ANN_23616 [Periplaneta americana]
MSPGESAQYIALPPTANDHLSRGLSSVVALSLLYIGRKSEMGWKKVRVDDVESDQKEEKDLTGLLVEKKLPPEGCTGRIGEWEKSSGQKKATVTGNSYLDMLQLWLLPQLEQDIEGLIFQQDGAPPHYHVDIRNELNTRLPRRWIGCAGREDLELYQPPLPPTIEDLRVRITDAIALVDGPMLQRVWQEIDYRLDVCRVTQGAHIEHIVRPLCNKPRSSSCYKYEDLQMGDEVTEEWRKLHNAELHAMYSSPHVIRNTKFRRLRWVGHVANMCESRNAYRVLVGRPEGKRPLGRPIRRWENNIEMDLREVGYDVTD